MSRIKPYCICEETPHRQVDGNCICSAIGHAATELHSLETWWQWKRMVNEVGQ